MNSPISRRNRRPNKVGARRLPLYRTLPNVRQLHYTFGITTDSDGNIGLVKTLNLSMLADHPDWKSISELSVQYRILHIRARYMSYNVNSICLAAGVIAPIIASNYSQLIQMQNHQIFPTGKSTNFHYNNSSDPLANRYSFFNEQPNHLAYFVIRSFSAAQANFLLGSIEITFTVQTIGQR